MTVQDFLLYLSHLTFLPNCRHISHHNGKWFHRPALQFTKSRNRCLIGGITAEMKTTDSLNRRNAARGDHFSRIGDRFTASFVTADQINLRPAVIAAHWLGIESSRLRIVVFLRTLRTHRKFLHAGPFSVIRQRIQDRQPRPAAGTIDKRMQIASVVRIIQLLFAFITNGNIR